MSREKKIYMHYLEYVNLKSKSKSFLVKIVSSVEEDEIEELALD